MDSNADRIVPLDQLDDFRVAEGDPDVRGWDVLTADGRRIGEVDNLLIDTEAMKVRYLEVDIDHDAEAAADRHILVPIGYARLDEDDDRIFVDSLTSTTLSQIPDYRTGELTRDYETKLHGFFDTDFTAPAPESDFYARNSYDDEAFFGPRRDEGEERLTRSEEQLAVGKQERVTGAVEVDKSFDTEHVTEHVPTRHEEVVIERRPASAGMSANPRIDEDEIRIPVTEEEVVSEVRTVPKEEIIVRKQERVEDEVVEADLRRERVDIHREGDVDVDDRR